ncbi:Desulfoferrodoxin [bioreactor metagenome]|uniref:Desulfoferrodoxin n=1 Tax=bioreactor metagenome TaxID=1076179 RepID=A0A645GJ94_9ZZZZ|nr:desulfoferrodoxin [Clostridiaceae bacterium HFYG-1003]
MAIEVKEIYKCNVCGNVVEVLLAGGGALVCCGEEMKLLKENTVDAALEKHVPVIEAAEGGVWVKVGSVAHPMLPEHWISTIEVLTKNGQVLRQDLNPGDAPQAFFQVAIDEVELAREYCNLHGLWVKANA